MAPKLKLTYFEVTGRAEAVRLAFAIGGIDFEDERIPFKDWPTLRPTLPYKSVPVLTIDNDVQLCQSHAILRYAGKLTDLYPSDPLEALFVDEVLATTVDAIEGLLSYKGRDEAKVKEVREKWISEAFPKFFPVLEKRIVDMYGGPFVLGEKLSIADLIIANFINTCQKNIMPFVTEDAVKEYKVLAEIRRKVFEIPQVVKWYEDKEFKKATHKGVWVKDESKQ